MSDAYACDRCGSLGGGEPDIRIITDELGLAGSLKLDPVRPRPVSLGIEDSVEYETTALWADLCEDCAQQLREFWEVETE